MGLFYMYLSQKVFKHNNSKYYTNGFFLEKRHYFIYIEADPCDALFFLANLLHSSEANNSNYSRRTLIVCFNTKTNNPYKEIGHARYTPLKVAPHNSIMEYQND